MIARVMEPFSPEGLSYRPGPVGTPATTRISKQRKTMCHRGVDLRPGNAGERSYDEYPQRPEQSPLLLHRQAHDPFLHWDPPCLREISARAPLAKRSGGMRLRFGRRRCRL